VSEFVPSFDYPISIAISSFLEEWLITNSISPNGSIIKPDIWMILAENPPIKPNISSSA